VLRRRSPGCLAVAACCAAVLAAAAVPALAAGDPAAGTVARCIEQGGTRYALPGSPVAAQYADPETACQTALQDPDSSASFQPSPPPADRVGSAPDAVVAGAGPSDAPSTTPASGGAPVAGAVGGTGPARPAPAGSPTTSGRADDPVLARASGRSSAVGAGSPLPESVGGLPAWLLGTLAGAAALLLGAGVAAARRRTR
jgi:hypothetical protein